MRQAETALQDGRLDEAFDLVRVEAVRAHRRGQELIGRLVRALAERGRGHLVAGRLSQASADCDKAMQLGGNLPEVAELRTALAEAVAERQDRDRRKANLIGAIRDHLHNGQLSMGERWLASLDDTARAEALRAELQDHRGELERALVRAEEAFKHEDWAGAVESIVRAGRLHAGNARQLELCSQVAGTLAQRVRTALIQGRLDQGRLLLRVAAPIAGKSVELIELGGALDLIGRSAVAIEAGQCRRAVELLHQARVIVPQAAWLEQAISEAERAAESLERLRSGPLGMMLAASSNASPVSPPHSNPAAAPTEVMQPGEPRPLARGNVDAAFCSSDLPRKFMLHVDGIGSFLVLRDRSVTLGGAAGSRPADVPLLVDGSAGPIVIERADEDYFLSCARPVAVNNQPVQRKLLDNGDRIAVSAKCHVRFALPNAASTSALLSIAGGRMPGTDATRVILLDRSMVIGPGSAAHVRADDLSGPLVLHLRDGRLFCNTDQEVTVDGRPVDRQAGLPLDAQVRIGPVSMVIRPT